MRLAVEEVLSLLEVSRAFVVQGKRPSKQIHLVKQISIGLWDALVLNIIVHLPLLVESQADSLWPTLSI